LALLLFLPRANQRFTPPNPNARLIFSNQPARYIGNAPLL
jgi:hypothetical protein